MNIYLYHYEEPHETIHIVANPTKNTCVPQKCLGKLVTEKYTFDS